MPNTQGISARVLMPVFCASNSRPQRTDPQRNSMDRLVIRGGRRIEGSVQICGAKNAALPQIAASLLSAEPLELGNIPEVTDVTTMLALMGEFGVVANRGPRGMLVPNAAAAQS